MINQRELAAMLGVTREHLNAVIHGRYDASKKLAVKLAKKTNSEPGLWIFGKPADRKTAMDKLKLGVR